MKVAGFPPIISDSNSSEPTRESPVSVSQWYCKIILRLLVAPYGHISPKCSVDCPISVLVPYISRKVAARCTQMVRWLLYIRQIVQFEDIGRLPNDCSTALVRRRGCLQFYKLYDLPNITHTCHKYSEKLWKRTSRVYLNLFINNYQILLKISRIKVTYPLKVTVKFYR